MRNCAGVVCERCYSRCTSATNFIYRMVSFLNKCILEMNTSLSCHLSYTQLTCSLQIQQSKTHIRRDVRISTAPSNSVPCVWEPLLNVMHIILLFVICIQITLTFLNKHFLLPFLNVSSRFCFSLMFRPQNPLLYLKFTRTYKLSLNHNTQIKMIISRIFQFNMIIFDFFPCSTSHFANLMCQKQCQPIGFI